MVSMTTASLRVAIECDRAVVETDLIDRAATDPGLSERETC